MATFGYIKLSGKFFENPFWHEDRQFSKGEAWLDLIQAARVEPSSVIVNGKVIELQRGQLCRSIRYSAKRWSWGEQKVRTFLKLCINMGMITQQQHMGETVITLVKYGVYNDKQHSDNRENNTPITQGQHTDNTAITQSIRKKESKNEIELFDTGQPSNKKYGVKEFSNALLALGVETNVLNDWIAVRKLKRQVFTETALTRFLNEVSKAKITVNEAVRICAEKSWGGFENSWYQNLSLKNQPEPFKNDEQKEKQLRRTQELASRMDT